VNVAGDIGRHEQLQLDHEDLDDEICKGRPSLETAESAPGIDYGALDEDVVEKRRLSSDRAGELEVGDCLSSVSGIFPSWIEYRHVPGSRCSPRKGPAPL
jgi:hypothetical protein